MNVWVNGCFDILHSGHLDLLEFAKNLNDRKNHLVVGIDSDIRVKQLKGNLRPINNEQERKRMLEALKFVDEVVIYSTEDEMCDLIQLHDIDYMVIGDDYKDKKVLCRKWSKNDVVFFQKNDKSSTDIINKIMTSYDSSNGR